MRSLKTQMATDSALFLNPREFGAEILVDGLPCMGLWDEETMPMRQFSSVADMDVFGVNAVERLLFVIPQHEAFTLPVPGQVLDIDNVLWTVQGAAPEGNIFKLTLYLNES